MTDATLTALFANLPATIAATTGAVVSIGALVNARAALRQGRENAKASAIVVQKTDDLVQKTTEIHTLTNGNLSKISAELAVSHQEVVGLKAQVELLLASQKATLLAAQKPVPGPPGPQGEPGPTGETGPQGGLTVYGR